jgi:ABC-type nickel/cobalt efflux system permease component RcnA
MNSNTYTAGQVITNIIFVVIAIWMIYKARSIQKNKDKSSGKAAGMVLLYIVGIILLVSMIAELAGVGR